MAEAQNSGLEQLVDPSLLEWAHFASIPIPPHLRPIAERLLAEREERERQWRQAEEKRLKRKRLKAERLRGAYGQRAAERYWTALNEGVSEAVASYEATRTRGIDPDDVPIDDAWRRLHETGFYIAYAADIEPKQKRRVA